MRGSDKYMKHGGILVQRNYSVEVVVFVYRYHARAQPGWLTGSRQCARSRQRKDGVRHGGQENLIAMTDWQSGIFFIQNSVSPNRTMLLQNTDHNISVPEHVFHLLLHIF